MKLRAMNATVLRETGIQFCFTFQKLMHYRPFRQGHQRTQWNFMHRHPCIKNWFGSSIKAGRMPYCVRYSKSRYIIRLTRCGSCVCSRSGRVCGSSSGGSCCCRSWRRSYVHSEKLGATKLGKSTSTVRMNNMLFARQSYTVWVVAGRRRSARSRMLVFSGFWRIASANSQFVLYILNAHLLKLPLLAG